MRLLIISGACLLAFNACINKSTSKEQENLVIDGEFDQAKAVQGLDSSEWLSFLSNDSLFVVKTKIETPDSSNVYVTFVEIILDPEATMGTKDRRILVIETDKSTGQVTKIETREGRYREDLKYYQDRFNYKIDLDSGVVEDTKFGLYGWE